MSAGKIIASAPLTTKNSFVLPKLVRSLLNVKAGQSVGYYKDKSGKIILSYEGKNVGDAVLVGASKLSHTNAITLTKDVKKLLSTSFISQPGTLEVINFSQEQDGRIAILITQLDAPG